MSTATKKWSEMDYVERCAALRESIDENRATIFGAKRDGVIESDYIEHLMQAVSDKTELTNCTLRSLCLALRDSATLGLPIGGTLGYGYVVGYKQRDKGRVVKEEAQFQIGYLGLVRKLYECPLVAAVNAEVYRTGEEIQVMLGTSPEVTHNPLPGADSISDQSILGAYAVIWLTSGVQKVAHLSRPQIDDHVRRYAKGASRSDSAWRTSFAAMCRKTVLRLDCKLAPLDAQTRNVLQAEEIATTHQLQDDEPLKAGDDAPLESLDDAAELIGDDSPAHATPEELADPEYTLNS